MRGEIVYGYLGSHKYVQKYHFKNNVFSNKYFFDTFSETNTFFKSWCFEYKGRCLLVWPSGPSWSKATNKTWWERIICTKISARVTTPWCIAAQCIYWGIVAGTHVELIEWLNALSNLWHGFATVSMGELGHSIFLSTMAPITNKEIPGTQTRKFAEQTRKFTEWSPMCFFVLNRAASDHLLALACCVYSSRVLHQSCFIRSWLSSSFTSDMMAIFSSKA